MNRAERARAMGHANRKHGQAIPGQRGPTYRSWETMKSRCNNPKDPSYGDYGARGIAVCGRWADSFISFLEDMGERPRGTTLDRIDVAGNYEPSNCRWADAGTQARNKRSNRIVRFAGEDVPLVVVAEKTGVPYQRLHERIVRRGWDVERAITAPVRGWR